METLVSMNPAAVDGSRLADLAEELPLRRSRVFKLLKGLGIKMIKGPGGNGKGRVAWVSAGDAERLRQAARAVHAGERKITDFSAALANLKSPPTRGGGNTASSPSSSPAPFLPRLEAAERAVVSVLGLTTAETAWMIGVHPGSSPLTRGGITATRCSKIFWRLSKIVLAFLAFVALNACSSSEEKKPESVLDYDPMELGVIALDRAVKLMDMANKASNRDFACRWGLQAIEWSEVSLIESGNLRDALKTLASKDDAFSAQLVEEQSIFARRVDFHKDLLKVYSDCKHSGSLFSSTDP
jgi:hypothetical protein